MYEDEIPIGKAKDLRGKQGKLTILYRVANKGKNTAWKCKCDGGAELIVTTPNLDRGQQSCRNCSYQTISKKQIIDITNQQFGRLKVIERIPNTTPIKWKCICDCGNYTIVEGNKLKSGHTQSCGCLQKERTSMVNGANLIGKRFGLLTVLERVESKNNQRYWKCLCDCGNITYVKTNDLNTNHTQSCGCKHESFGVTKIKELLNSNGIKYTTEKSFETCRFINTSRLAKFDFFIKDCYLIEFDGEQHFQESNQWFSLEGVQRDTYKNQWCKENNIPLIRIPYTKLNTLSIEDLMLETTTFRVV